MKEQAIKNFFGLLFFNCFCWGFIFGVGLFSYVVTENIELVPISQETNQTLEYLEIKAENCTSTGFVPETPFNEDYFNCEVVK